MIKTKKYKYIFDENFDFKNELKVITEEINLNLLKVSLSNTLSNFSI